MNTNRFTQIFLRTIHISKRYELELKLVYLDILIIYTGYKKIQNTTLFL